MLQVQVLPNVPYHNDMLNCLSTCSVTTEVITFTLKDLRGFNQPFDAVARVASLVYELLYSIGCDEKEEITFQARKGTIYDSDTLLSRLYSLVIIKDNPRHLAQQEGSISHCYAYLNRDLSGGKLCFFLNQLPMEAYDVITAELLERFPQPQSNCTIL